MKDRDFVMRLMDRAERSNCSALVVTMDLQAVGQRHKDIRNGVRARRRFTLPNLLNIMTKPHWALGMLGTRRHGFGNIIGHVRGVADMFALRDWVSRQFDPTLGWDDVAWIKQRRGGKLILKGIQDVEDARLAADSGADALVVSNHGRRQLDGASSSISALPEIVDMVGKRLEVHMDGGIRSGQDVLKALALGAKGKRTGHLQGQALACPAVPAGTNAVWPQTIGRALRCPAVDRLLARAISLQHLAHEHGQRNRWRIQPLAVLGQQRFGRLKQLRTRQHVEELDRLGRSRPASDTAATLMQNVSGITIHGGWPPKRWFGCVVTTILSIHGSATSFCLQIQMLMPVTSTSFGLCK
jgi:hypothetical protein